MSEEKKEAKVYLVDYICDDCGKGKMRQEGGAVLMSYPPKYPHKCNACGAESNLPESYPTIKFEEK